MCSLAIEFAPNPESRVRCHEAQVILLKEIERYIENSVAIGNSPPQHAHLTRFHRLNAEADLLKLKAEIEKAGKK